MHDEYTLQTYYQQKREHKEKQELSCKRELKLVCNIHLDRQNIQFDINIFDHVTGLRDILYPKILV